ncbi:hypothetical protein BT96DRAFT_971733 [Gymnopus androsaceus JB14]|uniref:Uncharacterized protein n=1 Tax=Gymnopus androsaceus JB14 TaxID=1447944 RepID=A0A6A4I7Z6_9AGAR|nr:hypothetical protein BT96DRAFT_971733 [Gymnopus androsaceus JB14]
MKNSFELPEFKGDPRLKPLLQSNQPPSSQDILLVKEGIDALDAYLLCLREQTRKIRSEKLRYKSLLGIRKLPPELLSEIFIHCTEPIPTVDNRSEAYYAYPDFSDAPYTLCQVSRQWRAVALSTPALWSSIVLHHHRPSSQTDFVPLTKFCLERSRVSPLYITLKASGYYTSTGDYKTKEIISGVCGTLSELMSQISRWEYLDFDVQCSSNGIQASPFPPIPPTGVPNLQTMCFRDQSVLSPASEVAIWAVELLKASPNLQDISFNALVPGLEGSSWMFLRSFEATRGMLLKDLFVVFMNCPALQTCDVSLDMVAEDPFDPSFDEELTLQHLHTLSLKYLEEGEVTAVLQRLKLPALRKLALDGLSDDTSYEWPDELFTSFLSRSKCKLEALSMTDLPYLEEQFISYLRHPTIHDTLEALEINKWRLPIGSDLLELLTLKLPSSTTSQTSAAEQPSPFLPKLKDVSFTVSAMLQAVPLRDFVASRWFNPAQNDVPLPVRSLERIKVLLIVPFVPNAVISTEPITRVFMRVSRVAKVELEEYVVQPSLLERDLYAGIEQLGSGYLSMI